MVWLFSSCEWPPSAKKLSSLALPRVRKSVPRTCYARTLARRSLVPQKYGGMFFAMVRDRSLVGTRGNLVAYVPSVSRSPK